MLPTISAGREERPLGVLWLLEAVMNENILVVPASIRVGIDVVILVCVSVDSSGLRNNRENKYILRRR